MQEYIAWQGGKFGRDINPSKLVSMLMAVAGVKRVEVTSPVFADFADGSDGAAPEIAMVEEVSVINGGLEDE